MTTTARFFCALLLMIPLLARGNEDLVYTQGTEVGAYAIYLWPQLKQPWTYAEGGEVQWARWWNAHVGACLALGAQYWDASYEGDDTYVDPLSGFPVPMHHKVSGYCVGFPLGGSLLGRLPVGRLALRGELGARFVPIVSQAKYAVTSPNPLNPMESVTLEQEITIRPPIIGLVSADLEYKLTPKVSLHAGGGYQFDLMQPEIEIDAMGNGKRTEANQMKAWFVRAGGMCRF